jgi:hypothetical protein
MPGTQLKQQHERSSFGTTSSTPPGMLMSPGVAEGVCIWSTLELQYAPCTAPVLTYTPSPCISAWFRRHAGDAAEAAARAEQLWHHLIDASRAADEPRRSRGVCIQSTLGHQHASCTGPVPVLTYICPSPLVSLLGSAGMPGTQLK